MENCDNQFQELDSRVYALHIQESNPIPSPELILIEESEMIEDGRFLTENALLEMNLDIVKIEDTKTTKSRKAVRLKETDAELMRKENPEYSRNGSSELLEETGSSDSKQDESIVESEVYNINSEDERHDIEERYLDLEKAAFAMHGLDLSLPIACDVCNVDFDDWEKFDTHMREHVENKCYMCQLCPKIYMSWQNLVAHRKVCHDGQFISCENCSHRKNHYYLGPINYPVDDFPVGCEECNQGFRTHNELNRHYRQHQTENGLCTVEMMESMLKETTRSEEETEVGKDSDVEDEEEKSDVSFKCNTCSEELSLEAYTTHKRIHPDICTVYKCPYCKRVFYTYSRYISHRDAHGIKEYKCKKCPRIFKNKLYWDVHKLSHLISKKYNCFNCQLEFSTPHDLSNHIKEVHIPFPERKLICDICTLHFSVDRFMKHYLSCLARLKSQQVSIKKGDKFTCSSCHEVFSSPKAFIRHKKVHNFAKDPHLCEVCGMSIQNLGPFIAHIRSHGKEYNKQLVELDDTSQKDVMNTKGTAVKNKSFICEFCGKSLKNNRQLKLHIQRHTGLKPFDCTICSMAFYTGEQLSVHMRHHTGERPYQCSICHKSFTSSAVLYAHRRLHNSTKQHVCPVCDKRFLWRSGYRNHMRTHSANCQFKCDECSKTFLFKHKLLAHKRAHLKGTVKVLCHPCTDCGQSFTSAAELQNHHENKCFLSMIKFLPSSNVTN